MSNVNRPHLVIVYGEHMTRMLSTELCTHILTAVQEAAKEAAKDAGMSDDEEEEEEGSIRQVMPGETAAAAMAAAAAAANAQLPTTVSLQPLTPTSISCLMGACLAVHAALQPHLICRQAHHVFLCVILLAPRVHLAENSGFNRPRVVCSM